MSDQAKAHWAIIDTHNRPQVLATNSNGELPRVEALHIWGPLSSSRIAAQVLAGQLNSMAREYARAANQLTVGINGGQYGP